MVHKCWAVTTVTDTKCLQAIYNVHTSVSHSLPPLTLQLKEVWLWFLLAAEDTGPAWRYPPEPFMDQSEVLGWTRLQGLGCEVMGC